MERTMTLDLQSSVTLKTLMPWYPAWSETTCTPAWPLVDSSLVVENEKLTQRLNQMFLFQDRESVLHLLRAEPLLLPVLLEAAEQIEEHFGPVGVVLRVSTEPEGDAEPRLIAGILTNLDPVQALERLDRFDASWWLDAEQRAGDKLCITLEYA